MITMDFDEMKKIWDAQNNRPLYVLDEKALHNRIHAKMNTVLRLTGISEMMLILINLGTAAFLFFDNHFTAGSNIFLGVEALWMFGIVVYLIISRARRIKASRQFDRTLHGDLDHAISLANYRIRIDKMVRWNFLPMGAILLFSGWESGKLLKVAIVIVVSYTLAFYVTSKGYQANKRRKRELEILKEKLEAAV